MCLSLLFKTKHNFYSEDIQFSYSSAKLTCLDSWKKKHTSTRGEHKKSCWFHSFSEGWFSFDYSLISSEEVVCLFFQLILYRLRVKFLFLLKLMEKCILIPFKNSYQLQKTCLHMYRYFLSFLIKTNAMDF